MNDIIVIQQTKMPAWINTGQTTKALGGAMMTNNNTKISGIYKITNTVNGHCYIGSAVNIYHRWQLHKLQLQNNKHHSVYLQRAWNKYGENCFEFTVLETCFVFVLVFREQYYMNLYSPAYNISPTAGSPLGVKHTAETRAKVTASLLGRKCSPETRAKMSASAKNHIRTPEHTENLLKANRNKIITPELHEKLSNGAKSITPEGRARISEIAKNRIFSPETRSKISSANIGKTRSAETKAKMVLAWIKRKAQKDND